MARLLFVIIFTAFVSSYTNAQTVSPNKKMIDDLNLQLTNKLRKNLELARSAVSKIKSNNPVIKDALTKASEFNLDQFKSNFKKDLTSRLIPSWLESQTLDTVDLYDCILFEYSDQEVPPYEAFSYGLFNMKDYKLTIEKHYYKYADTRGWEAGSGILLEPFSICKSFHIEVLGNTDEWEKLQDDPNSGVKEINALAGAICKVVLNEVFSEADNAGLFSKLKLKSGGLFMYDVHDGGNVQDPFYLKR